MLTYSEFGATPFGNLPKVRGRPANRPSAFGVTCAGETSPMRSTLLASCLLILSFGVLGCDDGMKKADTAPASAPTVTPGTSEPGKGAMEGSGTTKTEPAPAPVTPAAEPKKE